MNKKTIRTWIGAALMLFLMFAWMGPSMKSDAADSKPSLRKSYVVDINSKSGVTGTTLYLTKCAEDAKISAVKSSKPSVAAVSGVMNEKYSKGIYLRLMKTGKTKVTFKVNQGGKTYKLSTIVTVRKRPNPIASFKLGSKNYASKYGEYGYYGIKAPAKASKVSVKLKKGYKLESITVYRYDAKTKSYKATKIKNGSKVKVTGNYIDISINYSYKINGYLSRSTVSLALYK